MDVLPISEDNNEAQEVCNLPTIQERVAALEERTKSLPNLIGRLEHRAATNGESHALRNTIIGVLLTAFLGGIGFWGWFITSNLLAIKQQLADGGNKQIVAQLKNPRSQEQLRANLTMVVAQLQTDRADGKPPNAKKVRALSEAVSQIVKKNANVPEAWQAASQLVSYRANPSNQMNFGACVTRPYTNFFPMPDIEHLPKNAVAVNVIQFHDCTLVLDDSLAFVESAAYDRTRRWLAAGREEPVTLSLQNVHVIYRGGKIVPVNLIVFNNCTFEFQMNALPQPGGRTVTESLLAATDIRNVKVDLAASAAGPTG